MRRLYKYILGTLAVLLLLAVIAVGVFLVPSFQKALLTWVLSGPDTEVTVEEVRIRPGSALVSGLAVESPEARFRVGNLESRFSLGPLLFRRTAEVEVLSVSGLIIEIDEPEEPPEVDRWEEFAGVLADLPLDFRIGELRVDGIFLTAAGTSVAFVLEGRELDSRREDGRLLITLEMDDPVLPGDEPWSAEIEARPAFDSEGAWQSLCADGVLYPGPGANPLLGFLLCATPTAGGESYRIEVKSPGGPDPDRVLLTAAGKWFRDEHRVAGELGVDVTSAQLPAFPGQDDLPAFSVQAEKVFGLSRAGELDLAGRSGLRFSEISERFGLPEALDEIAIDSVLGIKLSETRLELTTLDIGISEKAGVDLARLRVPSPLEIDLSATEEGFLPEFEEPILWVDVPGLPPELIGLFLDDLRLESAPITARFALSSRNGRIELDTPEPLALRDFVLFDAEGVPLVEADLALTPSGFLSPAGFDFSLVAEGQVLPVRSLDLALQASGPLPLAETETTLTVRVGDLPEDLPLLLADMNGTVTMSHPDGEFLPEGVAFDLDLTATPREEFPFRLPERFAITGELTQSAGEFPYALDALDAALYGDDSAPLFTARVEQPIGFDVADSIVERFPEGNLLTVNLAVPRLVEWVPEEFREGLSGGELRGGFRVARENRSLRLEVTEGPVTIAGLGWAALGDGTESELQLSFVPFAVYSEERIGFGFEQIAVGANGFELGEASARVDGFPDGNGAGLSSLAGDVSVRGDLVSFRRLLGEDFLPDLDRGAFIFETAFEGDLADLALAYTGSFSLLDLRSTAEDESFAVATEFSGDASESGGQGEFLMAISGADFTQELRWTVEATAAEADELPSVRILGSSEYLDFIRLQALGELFSGSEAPEAEPVEPVFRERLLPLRLEAELTVDRARMPPDIEVYDLRIDLLGDDEILDLREARLRLLEDGEITVAGRCSLDQGTLVLASSGSVSGIVIQDLLRQALGVEDPDIRGRFGLGYEVVSRGAVADELFRNLEGGLNVFGEGGRLSLTIPDGRMQRVRQLTGMQEGAIGSLIARLAGAPPGVQALAESLNLLTDIPYNTIDARLTMSEGSTLIVEHMEFIGPYLFVRGTGRLENINLETIGNTPLDLRVDLGAQGGLREQFRILNLLSDQVNPTGYQMLQRRPVQVTGTLGEPNIREIWDLLIDAGVGAATAREGDRRDPVDDTIRGIRDALGW